MLSFSILFGYGVEDAEISPVGIGFGSAYSGLSIDNNAMQYNVGSLGFIKHYEYNLSHFIGLFGTSYESLSYITRFLGGGIGFNLKAMHLLLSSENNEVIKDGHITDELSLYDMNFSIGYGFKINKNLGLGFAGRYIRKAVMEYTASTFAGDIGLYYTTMLFKPDKVLSGKRGFISKREDDLRLSASIQNIGGKLVFIDGNQGDELPIIARFGAGFIPIENILLGYELKLISNKKLEFNDDSLNTGAGLELNHRFFRDLLKVMLRTGYNFNFNQGFSSGDLNYGGGVEFYLGATAYRLDYALKQMKDSDIMGYIHYLSLTIGESPSFFKWVVRKSISSLNDMIFYNDYFTLKSAEKPAEKAEEKKEKIYEVSIKEITCQDALLINSGMVDKFKVNLVKQIDKQTILKYKKEQGELVVTGNIQRAGEIIRLAINIIDPASGKVLGNENFDVSAELLKYSINYETIDILVNKNEENVKLIPADDSAKQEEEMKIFTQLAEEVVSWVKSNITEFLSGELKLTSNFENIEIFIDGFFYTKTGKNYQAKITVFKGKHRLELKLAKHPVEEREFEIAPGEKKPLTVDLKKGIVFNDYIISSYPPGLPVYLDNVNKGETPVKLQKIDNTGHILEYEDNNGKRWKQNLSDDEEGIYKVWHILRYSDTFETPSGFWQTINRNSDISVLIKDGLRISNKSKKEIYTENGVFSPYFIPGDTINITCSAKMNINDGLALIGIMDVNGNGFAYANDGVYHQYLTWGASGGDKIVQAININNKDKEDIIKITYNKGSITADIGEYNLAEVEIKLTGKCRIFILADGMQSGGSVDVQCSKISFNNK